MSGWCLYFTFADFLITNKFLNEVKKFFFIKKQKTLLIFKAYFKINLFYRVTDANTDLKKRISFRHYKL